MNKQELNRILEEHEGWLCWQPNCHKADLSGANLSQMILRGALLVDSKLSGAILFCADLSGTDLGGADLSQADLSGADLSGADLRGTDLSGAVLDRTDLKKADLRGAVTNDLKGKTVISVQVNTSRPNNLISYWKDLGIVTTGCFQGTLEELKKEVEVTHKDNEFLRERYHRAIAFIEKEAKAEEEIEE